MPDSSTVLVVAAAVALDLAFAEPPNRFHPVAWMGTWIARMRAMAPRHGAAARFLFGCLIVAAGAVVAGGVGAAIQRGAAALVASRPDAAWPWLVSIGVQAAVLKSCFSVRALPAAANAVAAALARDDLAAARRLVGHHLVSRDVAGLDAAEVAAATVESVAENTSDSFVAPIFFYLVCGLPGALIYRFVNTCDAMLGYRTRELEWLGKAAARGDDLLNLVPARLTALLVVCAAAASCGHPGRAIRTWWRDAGSTSSPNAGHPMSAAAGAIGVVLEKRDQYRLGDGLASPDVAAVRRMTTLYWGTVAATLALVACIVVLAAAGEGGWAS